MAEMGKFIEESMKSGVLLAAEGCMPSALGARVKLSEGNVSVTDGPFSEAKELIGGFALVQFGSMQEAVEYTKRFLAIAGDGVTEVRQLYEVPATDQVNRHSAAH
jgi:hypothetical protein